MSLDAFVVPGLPANMSTARMIQIMQVMGEDSEVARTRVQVLSDFLV